jgi:hypothetical protein
MFWGVVHEQFLAVFVEFAGTTTRGTLVVQQAKPKMEVGKNHEAASASMRESRTKEKCLGDFNGCWFLQ